MWWRNAFSAGMRVLNEKSHRCGGTALVVIYAYICLAVIDAHRLTNILTRDTYIHFLFVCVICAVSYNNDNACAD